MIRTFRPRSANYAGAGGARSRAIRDRISWNICRDTYLGHLERPWLTTFAPILLSFSFRRKSWQAKSWQTCSDAMNPPLLALNEEFI
jgi:hypothetical protein